jgi:two-component system, OmpR family, response regulator
MADQNSILLVEDDEEISDLIARYLENNGMTVTWVASGEALDKRIAAEAFDIIILDLNLPGEDGLSICRRLSATLDIPIIIVTAKGEDVDKIIGLEMGADDYLVKPFNPRELLARIRAVLRRAEPQARVNDETAKQTFHFLGWRVNLLAREVVSPTGTRVAMTGAEFDLLHAFCENPNRVLTRDQLINMTHGRTAGPFERSIDVLVSRLRQKLEKDPKSPSMIQTVRSEGYMLSAPVTRA